jgi:hypothetical protein
MSSSLARNLVSLPHPILVIQVASRREFGPAHGQATRVPFNRERGWRQ